MSRLIIELKLRLSALSAMRSTASPVCPSQRASSG
jgi:hypothetical protein